MKKHCHNCKWEGLGSRCEHKTGCDHDYQNWELRQDIVKIDSHMTSRDIQKELKVLPDRRVYSEGEGATLLEIRYDDFIMTLVWGE